MIRHTVISSRWDEKENVGYMTFRCNRCGYEYEWKAIEKKRYEIVPPKKPGGKPVRRRAKFTRFGWAQMAKWWGPKSGTKSDGCTVTECKGCLPPPSKRFGRQIG